MTNITNRRTPHRHRLTRLFCLGRKENIKRKGVQMNTFAGISGDACSELLSIHD